MADLLRNPVLKTGFLETENRWNNTFNFPKNSQLWKNIFIPWIKIWNFEDLKLWTKIVFEDFDEDYDYDNTDSSKNWEKKLIKETWFENFLWILDKPNFPPIFICDNHNHVLESWKFFKSWKNQKTLLIHIDQHKDNANYKNPIKDFRRDLRICDYINYAIDEKWISEKYISLCENIDFQNYFNTNKFLKSWKNFFWDNKNFWDSEEIFLEFEKKFLNKKYIWKIILNIDLDIFVDHQTMVNHEKLFKLIDFLKDRVDLISIASSPLFLKKEKVMWLIEKILNIKKN